MKKEDFFNILAGIDEEYIRAAKETETNKPVFLFKNWITIAATLILMLCSFSAGAFAFDNKVIVEVPVEQELISIEELGLTMILPDTWDGKYSLEKIGPGEYSIYNPDIRKAFSKYNGIDNSGGMLFYIKKWDEQLTEAQVRDNDGEWSFARNKYIMTTRDGTYLLYYASDIQFTNETEQEYRKMEKEISQIRFIVDNVNTCAFIKEINESEIIIDPIEYITSEDTDRISELNLSEYDMPNGYYFYNANVESKKYTLTETTLYSFIDWHNDFTDVGEDREFNTTDKDAFAKYLNSYHNSEVKMPFFINIADDKVIHITEKIFM
ncbi:MAG: hypothetical protein IKV96_04380 [Firmicutes bacterium]|nr:hypothetical protein [Bacillota bacterium]